jgi:hypothetical protein
LYTEEINYLKMKIKSNYICNIKNNRILRHSLKCKGCALKTKTPVEGPGKNLKRWSHPMLTDHRWVKLLKQRHPSCTQLMDRLKTAITMPAASCQKRWAVLKLKWTWKGPRIQKNLGKDQDWRLEIPISKFTTKLKQSRHCSAGIRTDIQTTAQKETLSLISSW